ncbi:MAG: DUF3426 domain-containing protein, partial [Rhodospirillaceae bacterium]|nr:DUF3426 domain-containing protein [Rhodospirillaceae bacterium]
PDPEPEEDGPALSQDDLDSLFGEDDDVPAPTSMVDSDEAPTDEPVSLDDLMDPDPIPEVFTGPELETEDEDGGSNKVKIIAIAGGVAFLLLIASLFVGRELIIGVWPGARDIYAVAGLDVSIPGEGLSIRDYTARRETRDGSSFMIIEGKITNITDLDRMVPPIKVSLLSPLKKQLMTVIVQPEKEMLSAADTITFRAEFENPPATAREMEVTFIDPNKPDQ